MASGMNPDTETLAQWDSPDLLCRFEAAFAGHADQPGAKVGRQEGEGKGGVVLNEGWMPLLRAAAKEADPECEEELSDAFIREQAREFFGAAAEFDPASLARLVCHSVRSRWFLRRVARQLPRCDAELLQALPEATDRLRATLLYARAVATQLEEMPPHVAAQATADALAAQRIGTLSEPLARMLFRLIPASGEGERWAFPHPSLCRHLASQAAADVLHSDPYTLEPLFAGIVLGDQPQLVERIQRLAVTPQRFAACLPQAARLGSPELVRACIAAGADPRAANQYGQTALHLAGSAAVVQVLGEVLRSAPEAPLTDQLEQRDNIGRTPLAQAASAGLFETVEALLLAGANPDTRMEQDVTPLMLAAKGKEEGSPSLLCADHAACVASLARHGA
eukprot:Hpha_TRINITY_DN16485_c1_g1::TRINITY_DN16485_c1_g1_i1::g.160402::m.160402